MSDVTIDETNWTADKTRLQIARDLREVENLYDLLREQAIARAGDPNIPGGAAMYLLGPGVNVEAFGYQELSLALGRPMTKYVEERIKGDAEPPLSFLASWSDIVRDERGHISPGRASIRREISYLRSSIDFMLDVDEDGDMVFIQVDDFADGLHEMRRTLEGVLYAGERTERIRARCRKCEERPQLVVRRKPWPLDGSGDDWVCPYCEAEYDAEGVAQCWHRMIAEREDAPEWVTPLQAAQATGRTLDTIKTWTKPRYRKGGEVAARVASKVEDGRRWVSWADVRAAHDTAEARRRARTA